MDNREKLMLEQEINKNSKAVSLIGGIIALAGVSVLAFGIKNYIESKDEIRYLSEPKQSIEE